MNERKNKLKADETFIREVIVNYRTNKHESTVFTQPSQVADFVRSVISDNSREHTVAIYLDSAHCAASYAVISIGTANSALLSPREIFQRAVLVGAISVILAHNHPSGSLKPSQEDMSVTRRIKEAGEILAIKLLDHVIVSDTGFLSLFDEGILQASNANYAPDGFSSSTKIGERNTRYKNISKKTRRGRIIEKSTAKRTMNVDAPQQAIEAVLDYLWDDERNDYLTNRLGSTSDDETTPHVFEHLCRIRYWLAGR